MLDWLVFRDARTLPLAEAIEAGRLRWLATPAMRRELAHMLAHTSLARWSPDREQALASFDNHALLCDEPPPSRLLCTDPDDQVFIDLALARSADRPVTLVTHDRALLKLARRAAAHGVVVLTPAAWCARDNKTRP